jgi:hypothetical protein
MADDRLPLGNREIESIGPEAARMSFFGGRQMDAHVCGIKVKPAHKEQHRPSLATVNRKILAKIRLHVESTGGLAI